MLQLLNHLAPVRGAFLSLEFFPRTLYSVAVPFPAFLQVEGVVKGPVSGSKSWPHHSPAVWPLASHLTLHSPRGALQTDAGPRPL